jgi:hypothetical protein
MLDDNASRTERTPSVPFYLIGPQKLKVLAAFEAGKLRQLLCMTRDAIFFSFVAYYYKKEWQLV